jgi:vesicle coat complex subunit
LGDLAEPKTVVRLLEATSDSHATVRTNAIEALGKFSMHLVDEALQEQVTHCMLGSLEDQEVAVRRSATAVLGSYWSLPEVSALGAADENKQLRAVAALAESKDLRVLQPLVAALGDTSDRVRSEAILALALFEDRAVEALKSALKHQDTRIRTGAQEALELIGTSAAVAALAQGDGL